MPTTSILKTKLYPPRLTKDHVSRVLLIEGLNNHLHLPISMICASSGYGKSILASEWKSQLKCPSAWLSLDEEDNDFERFLKYLIGSVQTISPAFGKPSIELLDSDNTPQSEILINTLINDLCELQVPMVLILDDYHLIKNEQIHELLELLIKKPVYDLHICLVTRFDPPLPLHSLRLKSQLFEIRMKDLAFTSEETVQLVSKMKVAATADEIETLSENCEGWITALKLRLASGNISSYGPSRELDLLGDDFFNGLGKELHGLIADLCLLERFNKELVAYCFTEYPSEKLLSDYESIIERNLFVINLDDENNWYRFHHLFQEQFRQQLETTHRQSLLKKAGDWFRDKQQFETAFHYYYEAEAIAQIVDLAVTTRIKLMNEGKWRFIDQIISFIPRDIIQENVNLQIAKAWNAFSQGNRYELFDWLDQLDPSTYDQFQAGEIASLQAYRLYTVEPVNFAQCHQAAMEAIEKLPLDYAYIRGFSWLFAAGSMIAQKQTKEAGELLIRELGQPRELSEKHNLHMMLNYLHWFEGNMHGLVMSARNMNVFAIEHKSRQYEILGQLFEAAAYYQTNELETALTHLKSIYDKRFILLGTHYASLCSLLALCQIKLSLHSDAEETIQDVYQYASNSGSNELMIIFQSLSSELHIATGKQPNGQWLEEIDIKDSLRTIADLYYHHFSLVRGLLHLGESHNLNKAENALKVLHDYFTDFNYVPLLAENFALRALIADARGDEQSAFDLLQYAVCYAESSDLHRTLIDQGDKMKNLLRRFLSMDFAGDYVQKILHSFKEDELRRITINVPNSLTSNDLLTDREMEILIAISSGLSNKEISQHLFISYETVKRHSKNIYRKLNVHDRNSAIAKAEKLGLLTSLTKG